MKYPNYPEMYLKAAELLYEEKADTILDAIRMLDPTITDIGWMPLMEWFWLARLRPVDRWFNDDREHRIWALLFAREIAISAGVSA